MIISGTAEIGLFFIAQIGVVFVKILNPNLKKRKFFKFNFKKSLIPI
jgi:hypothetical protein